MKNKRKLGFRIWVLFSIVLFLLIPLLSSSVAASFTYFCQASTVNKFDGPTSQTICPGPWTFSHTPGQGTTATFTCNYTFLDSNPTML